MILKWLFTYFICISSINSQFRSPNIAFITPENCTRLQYFNRIELRCETCPNSTVPSDDMLSCQCSEQQQEKSRSGFIPVCQDCPEGTSPSPDRSECLSCRNETCNCPPTMVLIYRDLAGHLLTNGAFCDSCADGFFRNDDGECERCGSSCPGVRERDGYINPPYLTVEYDDTTDEILENSLEIIYHKDPSGYDQKLIIALSILIPVSLFWSALCSYSWGRRQGKPSAVDASSILYFFVCEVSVLGDVFFACLNNCWLGHILLTKIKTY
ncbi:hypothetical protein CAEBREN_26331, partial [Caenorhabditis brenneri]